MTEIVVEMIIIGIIETIIEAVEMSREEEIIVVLIIEEIVRDIEMMRMVVIIAVIETTTAVDILQICLRGNSSKRKMEIG